MAVIPLPSDVSGLQMLVCYIAALKLQAGTEIDLFTQTVLARKTRQLLESIAAI